MIHTEATHRDSMATLKVGEKRWEELEERWEELEERWEKLEERW